MTGADLRQVLSKNIKSLRGQRSLSQIELAEKANISIPFLSNIERANKWPHPDTLVKIAQALDVDVAILFMDKTPLLPYDAQQILAQYRKDISVSLYKKISEAIDNSLETINAHYLKENKA